MRWTSGCAAASSNSAATATTAPRRLQGVRRGITNARKPAPRLASGGIVTAQVVERSKSALRD